MKFSLGRNRQTYFLILLFGVLFYVISTQVLFFKTGSKEATTIALWRILPNIQLDVLTEPAISEDFWEKRISNSCLLSQPRWNPQKDFAKYNASCPEEMQKNKWLDLNKLKYRGPPKYSSVHCSAQNHCVWENVCFERNDVVYWQDPKAPTPKVGWVRYRDWLNVVNFSYWRNIGFFTHNPPSEVSWVNGTTLFYDQSWDSLCHPGHSSEFFHKLVELRSQFPGKIDRILYGSDKEVFRGAPGAFRLCPTTCNLLRVAFGAENWTIPDMYWLEWPNMTLPGWRKFFPFTGNDMTCFEKVMVPANQFQHFSSREAAELHRNEMLKMCKIPKREAPESPKRVLFWQRGFDRLLSNNDELCFSLKGMGFESFTESESETDFCRMVASVYYADIIITIDGSHNYILSYARPGSVLIVVFPFNFRLPDWKLLGYYAGMRILEIMTTDPKHSIGNDVPMFDDHKGVRRNALEVPLRNCTFINCRVALRHRDTYLPLKTLMKFINHAKKIFNQPDLESCEKPLPWPVASPEWAMDFEYNFNWAQYGWQLNYDICEPPEPDCHCCKSEVCMDGTRNNTRPW